MESVQPLRGRQKRMLQVYGKRFRLQRKADVSSEILQYVQCGVSGQITDTTACIVWCLWSDHRYYSMYSVVSLVSSEILQYVQCGVSGQFRDTTVCTVWCLWSDHRYYSMYSVVSLVRSQILQHV